MPRPYPFSETQTNLIIRLYNEGKSTHTVTREVDFKCTQGQVLYTLHKYGVLVRAPGRPQNSIVLSDNILQLITGHILGDGHLIGIKPPALNSGFSTAQGHKHADVIEWTQRLLTLHNVPCKTYTRKDNVSILYTPRAPAFTWLRHLWYPRGKKIVPDNLILSPLTLLAWYLDDGTLHKRAGVTLYTNGFSFRDVFNLQYNLQETFEIKCNVREHYYTKNSWARSLDKPYPVMYIPKQRGNLAKFFSVIGPCPVASMQYKWPGQ